MLEIQASAATLGAIVRGVELGALDTATWHELEEAFHAFSVLVFPDQHLDDAAQIAFGARFGAPERLIEKDAATPLVRLTNLNEDGHPKPPDSPSALFQRGNGFWHADSSYKPVASKAVLLGAERVPASGGETEWADMRAAWDALEARERERIEGVEAVHSYRYSTGLIGGLEVLTDEEWDALPPVRQPMVWTHAVTGRRSLLLGRHASHVVGMDERAGRAWLERLLDQACRPPRIFRHRWSPGDLAIWDNRAVLHRGRPWPWDQARVMTRVAIAGDGDNTWAFDRTPAHGAPPDA